MLRRKPQLPINVQVDIHSDRVEEKLDLIMSRLEALSCQGVKMLQAIERLEQEVSETRTVVDSAIALIRGISQALKDAIASQDPTRVQAVSDSLDQAQTDLAAAVAENTPAAE